MQHGCFLPPLLCCVESGLGGHSHCHSSEWCHVRSLARWGSQDLTRANLLLYFPCFYVVVFQVPQLQQHRTFTSPSAAGPLNNTNGDRPCRPFEISRGHSNRLLPTEECTIVEGRAYLPALPPPPRTQRAECQTPLKVQEWATSRAGTERGQLTDGQPG